MSASFFAVILFICVCVYGAHGAPGTSKYFIENMKDPEINTVSLTNSVVFLFLYDAGSFSDRSKLQSIRNSFDLISHSGSFPLVVFAFNVKEKHTVDFLLQNYGRPVLDLGFKEPLLFHFKSNKWNSVNALVDINHAQSVSKFMQRKLDLFSKATSKSNEPQQSYQQSPSSSYKTSTYSANEPVAEANQKCDGASQCQQPTDAISAQANSISSTSSHAAANVQIPAAESIAFDAKKSDNIISQFLSALSTIDHAPTIPADFPKWADSAFNMFTVSAEFRRMHNLTFTIATLFEQLDLALRQADRSNQVETLQAKCLQVLNDITAWEMRVRGMKFGHLYLNQTRLVHTILQDALKVAKNSQKPIHAFFAAQQVKLQQRLQKDTSNYVPLQLADLKLKYQLLRSFRGESIPRVVHFMKTDSRADFFLLAHFLSIRSASIRIKPDIIKFHCVIEPTTDLWRKLKSLTPELQVIVGNPPMKLNNQVLVDPAHISDAWRMDILIAEGGIYLDWDVIVVRSFDSLLNSNVILGAEIRHKDYGDALGVAVMMCRPQEPFMIRWREQMNKHFDATRCYACHTIQLSRYLSEHNPGEIYVLPERAFYEPGWELHAAKYLYDSLPTTALPDNMDGAFAVHLFESHQNVKHRLHALTESSIRTGHSNFNHLVRPLLA